MKRMVIEVGILFAAAVALGITVCMWEDINQKLDAMNSYNLYLTERCNELEKAQQQNLRNFDQCMDIVTNKRWD